MKTHYHFHWLPSREWLEEHPIPCQAPDCEEGMIWIDEFEREMRRGFCSVCQGTGFDPEPFCGDCGEPLDPLTGPIGAHVTARTKWDEWSYLLCGACAWTEVLSESGRAVETGELTRGT